MIELKTPKEIEAMKPAGRFVGGILRDLKEFTKVGTNLLEIDEFVHKRIVDRKGASSCYVDYAPDFGTGPFAHYICTSVNDAVLHGVPYDYNLKDGDLVSLDLAINVDGWVADSAISFCVGTQHPAHRDEITLHKAAKEAFSKLPDGKIPKVKDLNEEFARLLSEKKAAYSEYKKIKKEMRDYQIAKQNVESFYAAQQSWDIEEDMKKKRQQER